MRVGEKEVSERAEIVARYSDLFTRAQLEALREAEEVESPGQERERLYRLRKTCEAGLIAAELAAREDALENAILAARVEFQGEELPLRSAQAKLALLHRLRDRDGLGELAGDASAVFNDERLEVLRAGETLEAEVSGVDDPIGRIEEEKGISLRDLAARARRRPATPRPGLRTLRERWFDRLLGPEREPVPTLVPRRLPAPPLAAGEHLHEGARGRGLHGDARRARLRPRGRAEHQARPRRPAAEVAARLRDPVGSAEGRPPDHARPGRAARLPGLPARGRPRAPLRRLRPGPAVHLPQHLARPRADGDLLVHRRGDLPPAGVARAALRPLGRRGGDECRGDHLHGGAPLPALRRQVPVRARLLGALGRGRRHARRATRSA